MPTETKAQKSYEVRPLTHGDLKNLKAIIASGSDGAKKQLAEAAATGGGEMAAGITMFNAVLDEFDNAMYWLGELAGFTPDDFDKESFDAHLDILEVLIERDNLPDFFGRYIRMKNLFSDALSSKSPSATVSKIRR